MKRRPSLQRGVTLIEMLVVIAIFGIVASILFFNGNDFNNNVSVRNLSQEIGLAIRKAQVYATSVRSGNVAAIGAKVYGISFSLYPHARYGENDYTGSLSTDNHHFALFADMAAEGSQGDMLYQFENTIGASNLNCTVPTEQNECVEMFNITTSDYVSSACFLLPADTKETCLTAENAEAANVSQLNILFRRPSPDAKFYISTDSGSCYAGSLSSCQYVIPYLKIVVSSGSGKVRKMITVWNTGQIEVL